MRGFGCSDRKHCALVERNGLWQDCVFCSGVDPAARWWRVFAAFWPPASSECAIRHRSAAFLLLDGAERDDALRKLAGQYGFT